VLLRHLGADGVIFPSARNDIVVSIDSGEVVDHRGWNFVDYAGVSSPEWFAWIEKGKQWPTQVGIRPPDAAGTDGRMRCYPEIAINVASKGGWQVQGLRHRTNVHWRIRLMLYALDCCRGDLSKEAWLILRGFPANMVDHGHIDMAGYLATLIFKTVLGFHKADEQLVALGQQSGSQGLQECIAELIDKVHRPVSGAVEVYYLRNQGNNDDGLAKSQREA